MASPREEIIVTLDQLTDYSTFGDSAEIVDSALAVLDQCAVYWQVVLTSGSAAARSEAEDRLKCIEHNRYRFR